MGNAHDRHNAGRFERQHVLGRNPRQRGIGLALSKGDVVERLRAWGFDSLDSCGAELVHDSLCNGRLFILDELPFCPVKEVAPGRFRKPGADS